MGWYWRSRDGSLERTLREARPQPREDLVGALSARVSSETPRARTWSRVSFAAALVVFMVGSFASFGGLGYASSGAVSSVKVVRHVIVPEKHLVTITYSSASDQYHHRRKIVKTVIKPTPKVKVIGVKTTIKPTAVNANTLPFTGASLLGTVLLGSALVALGVFLKRRESRQ